MRFQVAQLTRHGERAAGGQIARDRFGRERNRRGGNARVVADDHEMRDARTHRADRRQDVVAVGEVQRIVGLQQRAARLPAPWRRSPRSRACAPRRSTRIRSGTRPRSWNRRAISCASLQPFLLSGRSKSRTSESCSALAWRISVSRCVCQALKRAPRRGPSTVAHFEDAQRFVGGRGERRAGAQAEARAVARADDFGILDGSIVEGGVVVGAAVFEGVQRATNARHAHAIAVDIRFQT